MEIDQLIFRQSEASTQFPPGYLEQSRVGDIIAGNVVSQTVGTIVFLMRVYSRLSIIGTWKSEDYVLVMGWVFATLYSVCQYAQCAHGAGRHIAYVAMQDPNMGVMAQKWAYVAQVLLFPALSLPKLSICLAYIRIFYSEKKGRIMMQFIAGFIVLMSLPFMIETIFSCHPISAYWTEGRPVTKCLKDLAGLYINGSLNLVADVALMVIVTPKILALKLKARQKRALLGIVFLGTLAVAAGIVRMVRVGLTIGRAYSGGTLDPTWDTYDVSIWTSCEIYVSLVCASAPGVKPVVSAVLPCLLGSTILSRSRTTGNPSHGGIELNSKLKSSKSSALHRSVSMTGLTKNAYSEMGRGTDEESLDGKTGPYETEPSVEDNRILRTQQVTIQTSVVPPSPQGR